VELEKDEEVPIEPAVNDSDFSALVDDPRHSSLNESAINQQNQTSSFQASWINSNLHLHIYLIFVLFFR